jgi:hypothetical protein
MYTIPHRLIMKLARYRIWKINRINLILFPTNDLHIRLRLQTCTRYFLIKIHLYLIILIKTNYKTCFMDYCKSPPSFIIQYISVFDDRGVQQLDTGTFVFDTNTV